MSFDVKWYKNQKYSYIQKHLFYKTRIILEGFYRKELKLPKNLIINKVEPFSHFAWIASGGYSFPSLYPTFLYKFISIIDDFLTVISKEFFSAKMLIVLEKKMSIAIITGSNGLVGAEATNFFCDKGFDVVGIDNNLRNFFFGKDGSTIWIKKKLEKRNKKYKHFKIDIRNYAGLEKIFKKYNKNISIIIHCANDSHLTIMEKYPFLISM